MGVVDVLLNGTAIPVYEVEVEKQEKRAVDRAKFVAKRTQLVSLGDDVKVRSGTVYLFGGKVVEIDEEYDSKTVTAYSYAKSLDEQRIIPPRLYASKRPEEIVADLIAAYTTLTFSSTTFNSGVTLNQYKAVGNLGDTIRELAVIANADFWSDVDSTGVARFYFEQAKDTNLGVFLNLGGDNTNAKRIGYNSGELEVVNSVEVYGKSKAATYIVRYDFYENVIYTLDRPYPLPVEPISVRVRIRGQELSISDYKFDIVQNQVLIPGTFHGGGSITNPHSIEIEYSVDETLVAIAENTSSISTWGKRQKVYEVATIDNQSDLDALASKIVSIYGEPRKTLKVLVPGIKTNIKDGGYLTVYDPYLGIIYQNFIVRKVKWKYPEGTTELELGQFLPEIYEIERSLPRLIEVSGKRVSPKTSKKRPLKLYFAPGQTLKETLAGEAAGYYYASLVSSQSSVIFALDITINNTTYDKVMWFYVTPSTTPKVYYSEPFEDLYYSNGFSNPTTMTVKVFAMVPNLVPWTQLTNGTNTQFTYTFEPGIKRILPTKWMLSALASYNDFDAYAYFYFGLDSGYVRPSYLANIGVEYV